MQSHTVSMEFSFDTHFRYPYPTPTEQHYAPRLHPQCAGTAMVSSPCKNRAYEQCGSAPDGQKFKDAWRRTRYGATQEVVGV